MCRGGGVKLQEPPFTHEFIYPKVSLKELHTKRIVRRAALRALRARPVYPVFEEEMDHTKNRPSEESH